MADNEKKVVSIRFPTFTKQAAITNATTAAARVAAVFTQFRDWIGSQQDDASARSDGGPSKQATPEADRIDPITRQVLLQMTIDMYDAINAKNAGTNTEWPPTN